MQAAIMGRMAFLLPDARTVPRNGTPPSISNMDIEGPGGQGWADFATSPQLAESKL
jgi:hypothetical protein